MHFHRSIFTSAALATALFAASHAQAINVLFVGGNATANAGADAAVMSQLQTRYGASNVSYKQASAATTADANAFDVLVISSTPGSGDIRNKWHNSAVGIVNWEEAVMDSGGGEFGLSSTTMIKSNNMTQVSIDLAHPITKGLSGTVNFRTSGETLSTTSLAGGTFRLASAVDGVNSADNVTSIVGNAAIIAVDKGGAVGTSSPVEGRRVMFPITDSTFNNLTTEGRQLFLQSVDWAAGVGALAQWTFPTLNGTEAGAGFQATLVAPNVLAGNVSATGSTLTALIENPGTSYATQPVLRVQPTDGNTSLTTAVAQGKFFEFSVTGSGALLDLTSIEFDAGRGGASEARGWGLASSLDNFATILGTDATIDTVRPNFTHYTVQLDPNVFTDIAGVTFRMYVFSPGNGSTVEFDNITVNGIAHAIPEPASAMLGLLGVAGLALRRRRAA